MGYGTGPVPNGEGGGGGRERPGGGRGGQGVGGGGLKNWSSQRQTLSDEEALASAQVGGRGGCCARVCLCPPASLNMTCILLLI
jgi:hypothetical protein